MRCFLLGLLAIIVFPSAVACSPKQDFDDGVAVPRGEFRLKGWFYADAVVIDTDPGEEPETVYEGPIAFKVTYGPRGEHSYFGVLCGPRETDLYCQPEAVTEFPYGPDYPVKVGVVGFADDEKAEFFIDVNIGGDSFNRYWDITNVSTEAPTNNAINTLPPKFFRDLDEVLAKFE